MERRTFETPLGEVWLWGAPQAFETTSPTVLGITGAFAGPEVMRDFPALIDAPVLIADLPGNRCPLLAAQSVDAYVSAFSDVVGQLERPVFALGVSLGATVALGLRTPNAGPRVAIEPLLDSYGARAMWPIYRQRLASAPPDDPEREFRWNIFGVGEGETERRSYVDLLRTAPPGSVVAAGALTEGCDAPSVMTAEDRQAVRSMPALKLVTIKGMGHIPPPGVAGWAAQVLARLMPMPEPASRR